MFESRLAAAEKNDFKVISRAGLGVSIISSQAELDISMTAAVMPDNTECATGSSLASVK